MHLHLLGHNHEKKETENGGQEQLIKSYLGGPLYKFKFQPRLLNLRLCLHPYPRGNDTARVFAIINAGKTVYYKHLQ